jgi:hypothetical protein
MGPKVFAEPAHLFAIRPAIAFRPRILHTLGSKTFSGENPPYGAGIYLHLREAPKEAPTVTITDLAGKKITEFKAAKTAGLQRLSWQLAAPDAPKGVFRAVPPGTYTATVRVREIMLQRQFQVEADE